MIIQYACVAQLGTFASAAGGGSSEQKGVAAAPLAAVAKQAGNGNAATGRAAHGE